MYLAPVLHSLFLLFFFNDTATTEIYTLSLHDALPIWPRSWRGRSRSRVWPRRKRSRPSSSFRRPTCRRCRRPDRKSTRLNSSHTVISYAVFCLKKKKKTHTKQQNLKNTAQKRHKSKQQ